MRMGHSAKLGGTNGLASKSTPTHLWIVGVLALIWNAFGCYDYLMTRMRNTEYLASMMPEVDPNAMLAWVDSFPIWAQFGWGLGVWMGLARCGPAVDAQPLGGSTPSACRWSGLCLASATRSSPPRRSPDAEGAMSDACPTSSSSSRCGLFLYARKQASERRAALVNAGRRSAAA